MNYSQTYIAIPPGETIKEQLSFRGMSQKDFTIKMGLTEEYIVNLLNGEVQLTSDIAGRLESVLEIPAVFWENLENIYRKTLIKVNNENQTLIGIKATKNAAYSNMVAYS